MSIKIKKSKLISLVTEAVKGSVKPKKDVEMVDKITQQRINTPGEKVPHMVNTLDKMGTPDPQIPDGVKRSAIEDLFAKHGLRSQGSQVHKALMDLAKAKLKKKVNPSKPGNRSDASLSERSGDKYRQEQRVDGAKKDLKYIIVNHPEHKENAEDLMSKMNGNHPPLSAVRNLIQRAAGKDAHLPPQYRD